MGLGLGQHTVATEGGTGTVTTSPVTTTTGSLVVLMMAVGPTRTYNEPTDSKGNIWTQISSELGGIEKTRMYYSVLTSAGSSHTFTASITTAGAVSLWMLEILGASGTALDQADRVQDATSPYESSGVGTTASDEFLVGFTSNEFGGTQSHTAGNGFTGLDEVTDGAIFWTGLSAYRIVSSAGTYSSSFTLGSAATSHVWIATFKAAPDVAEILMSASCV